MPGLDNLALTPDGRLYITSYWDATVFEVATDGSGKYKTLFPMGSNGILGLVVKDGQVIIADAIMIRTAEKGKYQKTKINAWAAKGMPLPLGLADGPGDQVFWPDWLHGAVAMGNPKTGEFKPVAGELKLPASVLLDRSGTKFFVAEYGAGQITEVNMTDGSKKVVATGLEGPLSLTMIDNCLYVAEAKCGRISKIDMASGKKEVFLSGLTGKPGALGRDDAGNLYILDGGCQKLFRVNVKTLAISTIAANLPVRYVIFGGYPPAEFPLPMSVTGNGDVYIATYDRGVVKIGKAK